MTIFERLPLGVTAVMLPELDFVEQVGLCRSLGVTHYVYRPRVIREAARGQAYSNWGNHKFDLTPERLLAEGGQFRARLESAGLTPFATVPQCDSGTPLDELWLHFEGAAAGGAARVRVTPMKYPDGLFDYPAYLGRVVGQYRDAVSAAKPLGVKLVIEMHAGNAAVSPGLASLIVREFDPADVGVILDLPNAAIEGYVRPNLTLSVLRDHIDHLHLGGARRVQGGYDAAGFRQSDRLMCSMVESDLHIPTWVGLAAELGRPTPLVIEDYTPNMTGRARLTRECAAARRMLDGLETELHEPQMNTDGHRSDGKE